MLFGVNPKNVMHMNSGLSSYKCSEIYITSLIDDATNLRAFAPLLRPPVIKLNVNQL